MTKKESGMTELKAIEMIRQGELGEALRIYEHLSKVDSKSHTVYGNLGA